MGHIPLNLLLLGYVTWFARLAVLRDRRTS
jgi:hypothetical protein